MGRGAGGNLLYSNQTAFKGLVQQEWNYRAGEFAKLVDEIPFVASKEVCKSAYNIALELQKNLSPQQEADYFKLILSNQVINKIVFGNESLADCDQILTFCFNKRNKLEATEKANLDKLLKDKLDGDLWHFNNSYLTFMHRLTAVVNPAVCQATETWHIFTPLRTSKREKFIHFSYGNSLFCKQAELGSDIKAKSVNIRYTKTAVKSIPTKVDCVKCLKLIKQKVMPPREKVSTETLSLIVCSEAFQILEQQTECESIRAEIAQARYTALANRIVANNNLSQQQAMSLLKELPLITDSETAQKAVVMISELIDKPLNLFPEFDKLSLK